MKDKHTPKINIEKLCKDYLDYQVFDTDSRFEIRLLFEIAKVDRSFLSVEKTSFLGELAALNIELFGLAWVDYNFEVFLSKKEEDYQDDFDLALCTEIKSMKSYLEDDIWSAAGRYNNTIV